MTKILVVVINYFSAAQVASLLDQIKSAALPKSTTLSVRCIDNSNCSEQLKLLKKIEPSCGFQITSSGSNLGFGQAVNLGANSQDFDYLYCLNPDVCLDEQSINQLLVHARDRPEQGIWGGVTVDSNGVMDFRHAWQQPSLRNIFAWAAGVTTLELSPSWHDNYRHIGQDHTKPYPVDSVSGCNMLISAKVWEDLSGFDARFFLYSEEIDLCRRARSLGYQPTVVPTSKLQHAIHSKEISRQRLSILFHSKLLYADKHHGVAFQVAYRSAIALGSLARSIRCIIDLDPTGSRAWLMVLKISVLFRK